MATKITLLLWHLVRRTTLPIAFYQVWHCHIDYIYSKAGSFTLAKCIITKKYHTIPWNFRSKILLRREQGDYWSIILSSLNRFLWHYKNNIPKVNMFIWYAGINLLKQVSWFSSLCRRTKSPSVYKAILLNPSCTEESHAGTWVLPQRFWFKWSGGGPSICIPKSNSNIHSRIKTHPQLSEKPWVRKLLPA